MSERAGSVNSSYGGDLRKMIAATPCPCNGQAQAPATSMTGQGPGYENYDIPRNLGRQVSNPPLSLC